MERICYFLEHFFPEREAPIIEVGSKFSSFRSDTREKVSRFS